MLQHASRRLVLNLKKRLYHNALIAIVVQSLFDMEKGKNYSTLIGTVKLPKGIIVTVA